MPAWNQWLTNGMLVVILLTSMVATNTSQLPMTLAPISSYSGLKGWTWFPGRGDYHGIDYNLSYRGNKCVYIRSRTANPLFLGARLTQTFGADKYRGRRLKFSGFLKLEATDGSAALTMSIFDREGLCKENLGYDNMFGRNVTGMTDWTKAKVVLDVPGKSSFIEIGITMCGKGQVWASGLLFEETTEETTGRKLHKDEPQNLDFSE
jgi:hypothetical protein